MTLSQIPQSVHHSNPNFQPTFPNSIPLNPQNQSTQQFSTKQHSNVHVYSQKSTLFLGGLSKFTNHDTIKYTFGNYGLIEGIAWKQNRNFAFVKFQNTIQATRVIKEMDGKVLNGRYLCISYAKKELNTKIKPKVAVNQSPSGFQHQKDLKESSSTLPVIYLSVNQEVTDRLHLTALIVDKGPIKALKLFEWLKSRSISIVSVSTWGSYGYIVSCEDEESYKRMTRGPSNNELEFLQVIPMVNFKNKFSRIVKVAVRGIPFNCCSSNCTIVAASVFGRVLHIDAMSHNLQRPDVLHAIIETDDPEPINQLVQAKLDNCVIGKVWVEEVIEEEYMETVTDVIIREYNQVLLEEANLSNAQKLGNKSDIPVPEVQLVDNDGQMEEGEIDVTDLNFKSNTPQKSKGSNLVNRQSVIHNSMEKVSIAVKKQKALFDVTRKAEEEIKASLFKTTSMGLGDKVGKDDKSTSVPNSPLKCDSFKLNLNDYPTLTSTSPKNPVSSNSHVVFPPANDLSFATKLKTSTPPEIDQCLNLGCKDSCDKIKARCVFVSPIDATDSKQKVCKASDKGKATITKWDNVPSDLSNAFDTESEINQVMGVGSMLKQKKNNRCNFGGKKLSFKEEVANFRVMMHSMVDDDIPSNNSQP
ncbi:uncharacterized protein [Rutidosis leptorrhynchoides]|uniref:uncharacterized protein n=1 Tax=Rutidosis leptorrhynchoides TaxID=125765 RepID=UPI003A99327D